MASACLARAASTLQASKAAFTGKAPSSSPVVARPAASRFLVRAQEGETSTKLATVQQKDTAGLYRNFTSEDALSYLDSSAPGFYGFDPLGLSDPANDVGFINPSWLRYSEVIHCRFAMLGAAGCITPEILANLGVIPQTVNEVVWFRSGVIPPAGSYDKYWLNPWALFLIEIIAMQFAELRRLQDYRKPGSMGKQYFLGLEKVLGGSGDPAYPGGQFFNLFNLGANDMDTLKGKELENGRLAMLAMFGYGAQAVLTGVGPFENLKAHLADPVHNNILANFSAPLSS